MSDHDTARGRAERVAAQFADRLSPEDVAALADAIRYEIVGALRSYDMYRERQRVERENRERAVERLTEEMGTLFQRRLVLERTLGAKPVHRAQLVAELHRNEVEYQLLKRLRHEILKGERKP